MVKKYMYENLKHAVIKHLTRKFKKYSHFQTITTNNRKHVPDFISNNTNIFRVHITLGVDKAVFDISILILGTLIWVCVNLALSKTETTIKCSSSFFQLLIKSTT